MQICQDLNGLSDEIKQGPKLAPVDRYTFKDITLELFKIIFQPSNVKKHKPLSIIQYTLLEVVWLASSAGVNY
jgi:hypothetical protein